MLLLKTEHPVVETPPADQACPAQAPPLSGESDAVHERIAATLRQPGHLSVWQLCKIVIILAVPVFGQQVLMLMLNLSDFILAGRKTPNVEVAIAAVGIGGQVLWLINVAFMMIGAGATAVISRSIGQTDRPTADRTAHQALLLSVLIAVVATAAGFVFAPQMLHGLGLNDEALSAGVVYVRIILPGLPIGVLMFMGSACLRGAGDTRTPLLVIAVANVVNIALSWILCVGLIGPALGLTGIAIGTLVAYLLGGAFMLALLRIGRGGLHVRVRPLRLDPGLIGRVLRIGVFSGLEGLLMAGASTAVVVFITALDPAGQPPVNYPAYVAALRLESISFLPGFAFAMAGGAVVGQSLGAGRPDRAVRCGWWSYALGGGVMTVAGLLFVLFPTQLVHLCVSKSADPVMISRAATMVRICGFEQPFLAAILIFGGLLRGAGDTRFPATITVAGVGGLRVPGIWLATRRLGFGVIGAWCVMCGDLVVRGSLMVWRFVHGGWKKTRV
ncbi:MAG: putative FMN/FAD exporter YeeO [Phycisphaerae bacterium]|nr:putative FMN/FAD exporter YeeO [Phycisphaerae bacterium]